MLGGAPWLIVPLLDTPMIGWVVAGHVAVRSSASTACSPAPRAWTSAASKNAGVAVGIIDGFVYLGTAIQAFVYGGAAPREGTAAAKVVGNWCAWPIAMLPVALVGIVLSLTVWNARVGQKPAVH